MSAHPSLGPGATLPGDTPRTVWREDLIAALTGFLLITGLFLDGWNHLNLQNGAAGEFITPWHGLLYTGFNACAIWAITRNPRLRAMLFPSRPKRGSGASLVASAPAITPAKVAFLGMALVALGVVGDGVTRDAGLHASSGAMAPPFDFLLFTGAGLVFAVGVKLTIGRFVTINRQVALPTALAVGAAGVALFAFGSPASSPSKTASAAASADSNATAAGVAQVTPAPAVVQTRAPAYGRATGVWTAAHRSGHTTRPHAAVSAPVAHNDAPLTVAQTPSALPTTHQRHSASVNPVASRPVRRQVSAPVRRRAAAPAPVQKRAHHVWTNVAVPDAPSGATQSVTTTTTTSTPDTPAPASAAKPSNSSPAPATSPTPAATPSHGGPGQN